MFTSFFLYKNSPSPVKQKSNDSSKLLKTPPKDVKKKTPKASPKTKQAPSKKAVVKKEVSPVNKLINVKEESSSENADSEATITYSLSEKEESTSDTAPSPKKDAVKPVHPMFAKKEPGAVQKAADYSPDKAKYHPIKDAIWKHGEK